MKRYCHRFLVFITAIYLLLPTAVFAGGDKATSIVVVADTRRVSGIMRYFSDLYNTDIWMSAVWAVVLTAAMGSFLGWLMDVIMSRTGLDLKSRKIVEH
ncbi:MAG: DVU0150 family protein [Pseudomonadota bacterium]